MHKGQKHLSGIEEREQNGEVHDLDIKELHILWWFTPFHITQCHTTTKYYRCVMTILVIPSDFRLSWPPLHCCTSRFHGKTRADFQVKLSCPAPAAPYLKEGHLILWKGMHWLLQRLLAQDLYFCYAPGYSHVSAPPEFEHAYSNEMGLETSRRDLLWENSWCLRHFLDFLGRSRTSLSQKGRVSWRHCLLQTWLKMYSWSNAWFLRSTEVRGILMNIVDLLQRWLQSRIASCKVVDQ